MTTASVLDIGQLSDAELADAWSAGHIDQDTLTAECDRRDAAEQAKRARSDKARASARARNAEWEAAAYANYLAADEATRGFLLSEAGKATGRDPWPMLWQGSREQTDGLASDDLITWWDYTSPRPPSAREYAAAKRQAAAEQAARIEQPATPSARELAEQAATAPRPAGGMARYITALGAFTRATNEATRAAERLSGGIRR